jgi:EmrB/QacA subfamily drug resistance transporter
VSGGPRGEGQGRVISAVMLGVASGSILVPLNSTMLAVALPGVMDEFRLPADAVTSLVSLYLGAVAIALPVGGSLADRFGARRVFLAGVIGFGAASLVAALAGSFVVLQVARVLQAASGALVSTASATLIRETAPADRRGEAFGAFDLLTSTSAALGPFIGGLIVGAFGWRAMFFLAAPIAILAAAVVGIVLTRPDRRAGEPPPGPHAPLDVAGLGLLGLTIAAFLVALRGGGFGVVAPLAAVAVVVFGIGFVAIELRQARPAVDLRLFRRRAFAAAILGIFGATVVLHGSFILVPLLVERLLSESPATSGAVLLGIAGVAALVAPFSGRASDRVGRRRLVVAGSLVTAVGLALLALPGGAGSSLVVALLLAVVGLGLGLSGSPRQAAAFEAIEPGRVGMAAGTYYTGRYLGGVVGASLAGAVLGGTVTSGGVSLGFGILAATTVLVALVSLGLPGSRERRGPTARPARRSTRPDPAPEATVATGC